jgi:hypothetical protein
MIANATESDPAALNLYQRLHAVMSEVTYVQKDPKKVAGQYTAVKHDDVVAKVRPFLLKHGVVMACDVESSTNETFTSAKGILQNRTQVRVAVSFISIDRPEDRLVVHVDACGEDPGDKSYGKAISYAKKYAILTNLLLETGDDADHDASGERPAPTPAPEIVWPTQEQKDAIRDAFGRASSATTREQALLALAKAAGGTVSNPAQVPADKVDAVVQALEDLAGLPA